MSKLVNRLLSSSIRVRNALRRLPLPQRIYRHLHFQGAVDVSIDHTHHFQMRHFGYQVENDLFWSGYGNGWEATSLRLWAALAARSGQILDIGANTGVYSLAAKAMNVDARVIAFEPLARIAARLRENVALNGLDVEVIEAGVSDSSGKSTIFDPDIEHAYSASLNPDMLSGIENVRKTEISVVRIDDFAAERGGSSIDLVKLDVEKHEIAVLEGFGKIIARDCPSFLLEILGPEYGAEVKRFFKGLDYAFFAIEEGKCVRKVEQLGATPGNHLLCQRSLAHALGLGQETSHAGICTSSVTKAIRSRAGLR